MSTDIGDIFTVANSVDIDKLRQMQKAQMKLGELRERSEDITHATGRRPLGYFAYERLHPTRPERSKNGVAGGALFGGLIGGIVAGAVHNPRTAALGSTILGGVGIGAVIGGVIGNYTLESEESRVDRSLIKYEAYITALETAVLTHQPGHVARFGKPADSYQETLVADKAQPSEKTL